jgi:peptidoglycan pentaglycine glycine transferase (the first glycine)
MPEVSAADWNAFLASQSEVHLLQTAPWGELKARFGWKPVRIVSGDTGAQILFRRLPFGFRFAYLPKGPVGASLQSLLPLIDQVCHQHRAVFLKIEADLWDEKIAPPAGFIPGIQSIQPQRSLVVSLEGSEEDILARMKQKTRYNIRLAQKKGVTVSPGSSVADFYALMQDTGSRDGFGVHSLDYYQQAYNLFYPLGLCELLFADFEGEQLAALMVFQHQGRAWYFYGASSDLHRNLMPTYLLQWEAMRWAKASGCREYDLWGVPDEDETTLEAEFDHRRDGLWGVYRFKRGFGGDLKRSALPWDRVYMRSLYSLYRWWIGRNG